MDDYYTLPQEYIDNVKKRITMRLLRLEATQREKMAKKTSKVYISAEAREAAKKMKVKFEKWLELQKEGEHESSNS